MNKLIFVSLLIFSYHTGFSQTQTISQSSQIEGKKNVSNYDEVYNINGIEKKPEYPGGMQEFYKYIGKNFRIPQSKSFKGGKIIMHFVIEKDGSITDVKSLQDPGFETAEEATRVLLNSKKWQPGVQDGRNVRVMYTLPITLQSN